MRPLDIVVPCYRNAALTRELCRSLDAVAEELAAASSEVLAIHDSPGDEELAEVLREAAVHSRVPFTVIANERNAGFVVSANRGLARAVERRRDALLLNSDTVVFPGAIVEMRRVAALDPMIGFVNPRSNNASICSLPRGGEGRDAAAAHASFRALAPHLPEFQFLPTGVGFCLLIRLEALEEFGLLDESYSPGYNEENDLVMRANRGGYRAVLANRAFVYHAGGRSFGDAAAQELEARHAEVLAARYPEYRAAVAQYCHGPRYEAERVLPALLPDAAGRLDIVFDLSSVEPYHNGTFAAATAILRQAAVQWRPYFNVSVAASPEAVRFHRLDEIEGLSFVEPSTQRVFALALRFSQPFRLEHMTRMARLALVNVYGMLDPIAYDCLYLNEDDMAVLWGAVFTHADGVVYISQFGAEQFRRRFRRREGLAELVCPMSLDVRDYGPPAPAAESAGEYILVVGNSFFHKRVEPTVEALRKAFPERRVAALGLDYATVPGVTARPSGRLTRAQVSDLFRRAQCVVFPSLYEGFGMPVLEALAYRKPVLARDIPAVREVAAGCGAGENVVFYRSTADLVRRLEEGVPAWVTGSREAGPGWDAVACRVGEFCRGLLGSVSFEGVVVPRFEHLCALEAMAGQAAPDAVRHGHGAVRALYDREAQIADLRNSLSWRITAPLRALGAVYLRLTRRT